MRTATADWIVVEWRDEGQTPRQERFDYLLAAAGRRPALAGLDLDKAGIPLDDKGIPRFDATPAGSVIRPCSSPAMRTMIAPFSTRPQTKAASRATPDAIPTFARRPAAPFEHRLHRPADGHGRSEPRELTSDGAAFAWGEASFAEQGRARVMGRNQGSFASMVIGRTAEYGSRAFRTGRGTPGASACMVNPARRYGQRCTGLPFYHPVLEEGLRTALQGLARALRDRPTDRRPDPARHDSHRTSDKSHTHSALADWQANPGT
jgi:dihydrolipoamide dehydrogenase